ncbi:MAG: SRPBCC family protein [Planctomycetota bacterium]
MPQFHVKRSIQIDADPDLVFNTIADFKTWPEWSPWLLAEREAKLEFSDAPAEANGWYSWDGEVVGAGKMQHVELSPPDGNSGFIRDQLNFLRPWKSEAQIRMNIAKTDDSKTELTWSMDSAVPFFLFFMKSMLTAMIGMDYDRGLRMLKEHIESGTIHSETSVDGESQFDGVTIVGLSETCSLDDVGPSMQKLMESVKEKLGDECAKDQQWVSLYHKLNFKTREMQFTTGVYVEADSKTPTGLVRKNVPATRTFQVSHRGTYQHLGNAWFAAHQHLQAKKLKANRKLPGVEVYTGSMDGPAEDRVTEIHIPLKG